MSILKTLLKGLGYSVCFAALTLMFTLLTFPEEKLREYIEVMAGHATGGRLSIAELSLSGLGGVEVVDAVLKMPAPAPSDRPGGIFQVQALDATASVLALLEDIVDVEFEATVLGGSLTGGHVVYAAEGFELAIDEVAEVRIGTAGLILESMAGVNLRGTLGGRDLQVAYGTDWSSLTADLDIDLTNARLVDPTVPTKQLGPLSLSTMSLGQVQLTIKAGKSSAMGVKKKRGPGRKKDPTVIRLANVGASGGDVEFQFDDQSVISIPDKAPMMQWGLDIHAAIRIKDAYIDHTIEKDGELEQPNKLLRMYFQQDARMRAAMRDGVFGLTCRGTFTRPNCRPTPTTIRGFKKRKPRFTGDEPEAEAPKDEVEAPEPKAKPGRKGKRTADRKGREKENLTSRSSKRPKPDRSPSRTVSKRDGKGNARGAKPARDRARNGRPNVVPSAVSTRAVPTIVPPVNGARDEAYADDGDEDEDDDDGDEDDDDDDDDEDDDEDDEEDDEDDEEEEEDEEEED